MRCSCKTSVERNTEPLHCTSRPNAFAATEVTVRTRVPTQAYNQSSRESTKSPPSLPVMTKNSSQMMQNVERHAAPWNFTGYNLSASPIRYTCLTQTMTKLGEAKKKQ
ncbi:unnamed protein product [Ceratitis capitata]|uniref:(Mediterranean fruit fly) hypothetical protein n=1 Tax=Ceratitis capitata TaxID=7213 RepID=A0A811V634_CERCA|nr:unnamed protein product [Ceratitis capitata]